MSLRGHEGYLIHASIANYPHRGNLLTGNAIFATGYSMLNDGEATSNAIRPSVRQRFQDVVEWRCCARTDETGTALEQALPNNANEKRLHLQRRQKTPRVPQLASSVS